MSIPKVIHYCWFGGNPKPELVKKCIKSWKSKCPDYEIIEWNESNYDINKNQYMLEAYQSKKWGFVPDFARLDIVYNHGGFYLDTDVELIKSLDSLLQNKCYLGIESNDDEYFVALGLGFGSEKKNKIIGALLKSYENINFINEDGRLNLTPSPVLNTNVLINFGFVQENKLQRLSDVVIYPSDYFCPKSFSNGEYKKTRNTISVHHYAASWFTEEQQKNYRKKLRAIKFDRIIHTPNRMLRKILGDSIYSKLKQFKETVSCVINELKEI